ncbi:hypothetical protein MMC25_002779 [Agyrium rufum]|nr:hypothetical protein [Agyrium rufum]
MPSSHAAPTPSSASALSLPSLSSTFPLTSTDISLSKRAKNLSFSRHKLLRQKDSGKNGKKNGHGSSSPSIDEELELLKTREAAIREARREIRDHVREDWEWPPVVTPFLPVTGDEASVGDGDEEEARRRVVGVMVEDGVREMGNRVMPDTPFVEREQDDSGLDTQEEWGINKVKSAAGAGSGVDAGSGSVGGEKNKNINGAMKSNESGHVRRAKRRKIMLEEMQWNGGLRTWAERRDAWTGGITRWRTEKDNDDDDDEGGRKGRTDHHTQIGQIPPPGTTVPLSSIFANPHIFTSPPPPPSASTCAPASLPAASATESSKGDIIELHPLPTPLLPPTNPILANISPAVYPAIYDKIVLQSQAPTIPINLSHLTRALVQGWKANDEWPPKVGILEPVFARRRRRRKTVLLEEAGENLNLGLNLGDGGYADDGDGFNGGVAGEKEREKEREREKEKGKCIEVGLMVVGEGVLTSPTTAFASASASAFTAATTTTNSAAMDVAGIIRDSPHSNENGEKGSSSGGKSMAARGMGKVRKVLGLNGHGHGHGNGHGHGHGHGHGQARRDSGNGENGSTHSSGNQRS